MNIEEYLIYTPPPTHTHTHTHTHTRAHRRNPSWHAYSLSQWFLVAFQPHVCRSTLRRGWLISTSEGETADTLLSLGSSFILVRCLSSPIGHGSLLAGAGQRVSNVKVCVNWANTFVFLSIYVFFCFLERVIPGCRHVAFCMRVQVPDSVCVNLNNLPIVWCTFLIISPQIRVVCSHQTLTWCPLPPPPPPPPNGPERERERERERKSKWAKASEKDSRVINLLFFSLSLYSFISTHSTSSLTVPLSLSLSLSLSLVPIPAQIILCALAHLSLSLNRILLFHLIPLVLSLWLTPFSSPCISEFGTVAVLSLPPPLSLCDSFMMFTEQENGGWFQSGCHSTRWP